MTPDELLDLAGALQELAASHPAKRARLLAGITPQLFECELVDPSAVLPILDRGDSTAILQIAEKIREAAEVTSASSSDRNRPPSHRT